MDNSLLSSGLVATAFSLLFLLYKACNHHKIKSKCCSHIWTASIDIDETSKSPLREEPLLSPTSS